MSRMCPNKTTADRFLPPENELEERFVLAGGPGGQHVNRTESAVQLRFNVHASRFVPDAVKARLLELAGRRADSEGVITLEAKRFRSQHRNRDDARQRLAALIERAHRRPARRIRTRPSRAAKKKRLRQKRERGQIKQARRKPGLED